MHKCLSGQFPERRYKLPYTLCSGADHRTGRTQCCRKRLLEPLRNKSTLLSIACARTFALQWKNNSSGCVRPVLVMRIAGTKRTVLPYLLAHALETKQFLAATAQMHPYPGAKAPGAACRRRCPLGG